MAPRSAGVRILMLVQPDVDERPDSMAIGHNTTGERSQTFAHVAEEIRMGRGFARRLHRLSDGARAATGVRSVDRAGGDGDAQKSSANRYLGDADFAALAVEARARNP